MKFRDDIVAKVPVECLIEDIQMLRMLLDPDYDRHNLKEDVNCVIDCLQESLDRYTEKPDDLPFNPSGHNVVVMSFENGIVVNDDGSDLECAGGVKCSEIGFNESCSPVCPYYKDNACRFETGKIAFKRDNREIISYEPFSHKKDSVDGEALLELLFGEEAPV